MSEYYASGLLVPITLWGVKLDTEFHLIINLMDNPSLLGLELLNASTGLPCNEGNSFGGDGGGRIFPEMSVVVSQLSKSSFVPTTVTQPAATLRELDMC